MKETLQLLLSMNTLDRQQYISEQGDALIENMMHQIGNPDYELRDQLNYRLFIELLTEQLFTNEQLAKITKTLQNQDFLYAGIGEKETDTVFTRSFSALWLTALLYADAQIHFLSNEEAAEILATCAPFLSKEKDARGFVGGDKGWANAISHGADLAGACIVHPSFELRLAPIILQGIKDSFWKDIVYVDDEDEHLTSSFCQLISKDYPEEILIEWVEQVFDKLQFYLMEVGYTPQFYNARTNTLHFMKTLYFTLKVLQKMPELKGVVSIFISKWMKQ